MSTHGLTHFSLRLRRHGLREVLENRLCGGVGLADYEFASVRLQPLQQPGQNSAMEGGRICVSEMAAGVRYLISLVVD